MGKPKILYYIKELYLRYLEDEVPALGAQMAYYFLLSVFPFLIFLMTIIRLSPLSSEDVLEPLSNVLPHETYLIVKMNVEQVTERRNLQLMSIGLATTLWAASNGVGGVIHALNKAYDVREKRPFWIVKGLSILCTIALSLTVLFYFILLIFGRQIGDYMVTAGLPPSYRDTWEKSRYIVIILMMVMVFALLYHFTPCRRLKWRYAFPGAVFTTVVWLLTSLGFTWYVDRFWNLTLVYGSLGGIIALLVWLYLSATMIIMGGEINAVLAFDREKTRGDDIDCIKKKKQN